MYVREINIKNMAPNPFEYFSLRALRPPLVNVGWEVAVYIYVSVSRAVRINIKYESDNIEYRAGEFEKLSDYRILNQILRLSNYHRISDSEKTIGFAALIKL